MSGSDHDPKIGFFMHLFLDAEMPGSPLQGHQFGYAITQLNTFLQKIKKGNIKEEYVLRLLSKETLSSTEVDAFIEQVGFLKQCEDNIQAAIYLGGNLSHCASQIFDYLLKVGRVDFPGGYRQKNGGHAMVYRFIIDKQNKRLLFLVLNSGAGLTYHPSTINPQLTKTLYENVVAYQIPFTKLPFTPVTELKARDAEQEEWRLEAVAFITELLRPRIPNADPSSQQEASHLYENVFEKIRFLGGEGCHTETLKPDQVKTHFITGQRSGTCTQKALNQLVKEHFTDKKAATAFMLAYRLDYLSQYIEYLKSKELDRDPEHRHYVVAAVRNLSRILVEDLDKLPLDSAHTAAIQQYLASILREFSPPVKPKKPTKEVVVLQPPVRIQFSHSVSEARRDVHQQVVNKLAIAPKHEDLGESLAAIFTDPSVDAMESVKKLCINFLTKRLEESREVRERKLVLVAETSSAFSAEIKRSDSKPEAPVSVLQSVFKGVKWFIGIPTSNEETVSVLPLIQNLIKAVKCFNGQLSPQSITVYFTLMVLGLMEFDKPELRLSGPSGIALLDVYAKSIFKCLRNSKNTPYLASYTPEFDLLLKRMEEYLAQKTSADPFLHINNTPIKYYIQVIDQYPAIAQRLAEKYQKTSEKEMRRGIAKLHFTRFPLSSLVPMSFSLEDYLRRYPDSEKLWAYLLLLTEEERLEPAYYPLTKAFDQVRQYEEYMNECFAQIMTSVSSNTGLDLNPEHRKLTPAPFIYLFEGAGFRISSPATELISSREFELPLPEIISKDNGLDAAFKYLLKESYEGYKSARNSNYIQYHIDDPVTRDAAYNRIHLYMSYYDGDIGDYQLEKILGYYQLHPKFLYEEKHRVYLSLCLFEARLLVTKFLPPVGREEEAGAFLNAFTGFFESSFAFYGQTQGGKISEAQLFLLQLATQLYGYAAHPDFVLVRSLAYQQLCDIEKTLQDYLNKSASRDKVVGLKLRKIKILLLVRKSNASFRQEVSHDAKQEKEDKIQETDSPSPLLEELIRLKLQIAKGMSELSADLKESLAEKEFSDHLNAQIHDHFIRHHETVLKCLPTIVQESYPELALSFIKAEAIEGQPLLYRLISSSPGTKLNQDYRIDLGSGFLMMNDRYRKPLPASVRSNESYIQVVGEKVVAWFSPRDSFYYFTHQGKSYRALDCTPPVLQMLIQDTWYTVYGRRPSSLRDSTPLKSFVAPLLYQQSRYRWCFKDDQAYIYDGERGYFAYHCKAGGREVDALASDEAFKIIGKVDFTLPKDLLAPFLAVESSEFIEVLQTGPGSSLVNLPRYGLQFEVLRDKRCPQAFCFIDNKKFALVLDSKLDFSGFSAYLLLEAVEEKASEQKSKRQPEPKRVVRVPWQTFMVEKTVKKSGPLKSKQVEGLHYKLIQDHQLMLKKLIFKDEKPSHTHWWHYNRTERMVDFTLSASGELQAHSAADQLYLVYIYLANNRPDLADKLLREVQLLGSVEELENAFLILTQLPAKEEEQEEQLDTPANLAVQNRLLYMLAELGTNRKKPIQIPEPKAMDTADDNVTYARYHHRCLLAFYHGLDRIIAAKHCLYLNTLNNIPASYRLEDEEAHQLLSYYVMGHRCLMHSYSTDQRDVVFSSDLDSLLLMRWAAFQKQTIQHLQGFSAAPEPELEKVSQILGKKLVLKTKNLYVDLAGNVLDPDRPEKTDLTIFVSVSFAMQEEVIRALFSQRSIKSSPVVPRLSLALTQEELIKYFIHYYDRLLDEKEIEFRASTEAFCERALTHCALLSEHDEEWHKLPYFHFLLMVARNPQAFKPLEYYKKLNKKSNSDRRQAIAKTWRENARTAPPIVISGIRELHSQAVEVPEKRVVLPTLSTHTSLESQAKEFKQASLPIATDVPNLEKIRHYKTECERKVSTIKDRASAEFKEVRKAFRHQKKLEDEVAEVVATYNVCIDQEIIKFFAIDNRDGFVKLLSAAQKELQKKTAENVRLKADLYDNFFKAESLDELLKEMGGLSDEITPHTILLLARLVAKSDRGVLEKFPQLKAKKKEFLEAAELYLATCFAEGWLKRICEYSYKDLPSQRALVRCILDYNVSTRWETHLLQYVDNIAVYSEQQAHLDAVLSLPTGKDRTEGVGTTVHLPMGAGKTALLLPVLAADRADGERLVVVQVPAPLLPSVFPNLSKTSKRVYQQRVVTLEFDRDSDCSLTALYRYYCLLIDLIAHRGYLMITKASRDALDAKLQELLAYADTEMQAGGTLSLYTQRQIHYLAKINRLLEDAYTITDEGHEASRIRDEMRYTFGKKIPIPKGQIRDLQLFFDRFFKIKYDSEHTFFDLIRRNSNLPVPNTEELTRIIQSFFETELLAACFAGKSKAANEKLKAFFFNTDDSDPKHIKSFLTPEEYPRALLYRELFQNFLNYALSRRLFVHYGPAEDDDPRAQLGLAVYFKYNNTRSPNQFSHYLETAVLSIFMVYGLGIDRYTFDRLMHRFYEKHFLERRQRALAGKIGIETETEKLFKTLFGFELETVDLNNPKAMDEIFNAMKSNPEVITLALRDEILPNVDAYDEELFKDSITHAYRYKDRILLSGTLRSHKTFDHKVDHQPARTLAVNGSIRKKINDNTRVVVLRKMGAKEAINAWMEVKQPGDLTAIIDVGAHLDGISNFDAARYIAEKLLAQGRVDTIKFVLFCDAQEQWCALSTQDIDKPLIRLNGTTQEELNKKLGPVGCYFTFYDQARSEGVDIGQPSMSRAVVTVAKDTTESAYQQGCMRMRALGDGQTLTVVVPDELSAKMRAPGVDLQPADVADYTFETELTALIPDHQHAARFRLFNVVREDLSKRMKQVPESEWPKYFGHFREFFIRSQSLSAIELFASKWEKTPLQALLDQEAKDLLSSWQRVIKAAGLSLKDEEVQAMRAQLDKFIAQALLDCEPEVLNTRQRSLGTETQMQLETKTTSQMQVRRQVQSEAQLHDPSKYQVMNFLNTSWICDFLENRGQNLGAFTPSSKWIDDFVDYPAMQKKLRIFLEHTALINAYQGQLDKVFPENSLNLSNHIYGSYNYYHTFCQIYIPSLVPHNWYTYKESKPVFSLYGRYTKPIHTLLFVGTEPLSVVILTLEEARQAKAHWYSLYKADPTGEKPCLWLQDISGILVAGERPVGIRERSDYQSLMEQLWFLNGNIHPLMDLEEFHWLSHSSQAKLEFYKKHISKAHVGMEEANIEPLEERLLQALSLSERISLYRRVQEQIIKLGFTKAACERPEDLNKKQFERYLTAMRYIWDAAQRNEIELLATKNWGLEYTLPLEIVALLTEYMRNLQKMQNALSSSEDLLDIMLAHMDQWLYVYPQSEVKAEDNPPPRFVEVCIDRLVMVNDAKALEQLKQELRVRDGLEALSDEEKSRYRLRLLECVRGKVETEASPVIANTEPEPTPSCSEPLMPLLECDHPVTPPVKATPFDSKIGWVCIGLLSVLMGGAVFILSMIGVICFPLLPIIFTILTTAVPICLGFYVLVRVHNIPHKRLVKASLTYVDSGFTLCTPPASSASLTPEKATMTRLLSDKKPADKPGSVVGNHLSGMHVTIHL